MTFAAQATDSFTRANGALGSPWIQYQDGGIGTVFNELTISSNVAVYAGGSGTNFNMRNDSWADSQESSAIVNGNSGVVVRYHAVAGIADHFYWANTDGSTVTVYRWSEPATLVAMGSTVSNSTNGKRLALRATNAGSNVNLEMFINSVSVYTFTHNSGFLTGTPGIQASSGGSIDDWQGLVDVPADSTAPTYSANPHVTTMQTNTTVTFGATASDETDTAVDHYMGVYANGSTPTAANIKAGAGTGFVGGTNKSQLNIANGVAATFASVTGLTAATDYDAWFTVEEHGATKNPAAPFKVDFKTAPTLALSTIGHLTVTGKNVLIGSTPVVTKVSFAIKQAWDNANYASKTALGYAVYGFTRATQAITSKLAGGTTETTDGSGVIEVTTTTVGYVVGAEVIVLFWKLGGGPAGQDICGMSFETLVAGP